MRLDQARRQLVFKIVYCGPGLAGKSTNLARVHAASPPGTAGELASEEAHSERVLRFLAQRPELGQVHGMGVQAEFWTIPGQSYYAATRRQLLAGADGVVFVADSRREALDENIQAMNEMLADLRHHGLGNDLPVVLQYNRQDAPTALSREQLDPLMNVRGWTAVAAVASEGRGVIETAAAILAAVAEHARSAVPPDPAPPASWLIACHRCQAMLEVASADPGEIYTCGVCGSQLEVVDRERGLTRPPEPSRPVPALPPPGDYTPGAQAAQPQGAATSALLPQVREEAAAAAGEPPYLVPGFAVVAELDASPQGRRHRVRELATGRTLRALALSSHLLSMPGFREGIESWAQRAGQVRHANILPLVGVYAQGAAMVFFSADPPDHEPLSRVLARRRALAPPHAIGLLRQLVLALAEAAAEGVSHGWIRPDCVLVSGDGNVLLDELCVPVSHRFLVRELAGDSAATEYCLAPEHLADDARADVCSDMFELGALLYRMMSGEGLVTGYNAHEALHKVSAGGPRLLRDAVQGVSRELSQFHQRLVGIDRQARFADYRELLEQLDRFGGGARRQALMLTAPQSLPGASVTPRRRSGGLPPPSGTGAVGVASASAHRQRPLPAVATAAAPVRIRNGPRPFLWLLLAAVVVAAAVVVGRRVLPEPVGAESEGDVPPSASVTSAAVRAATGAMVRGGLVAVQGELQARFNSLLGGRRFAAALALCPSLDPPELRPVRAQAVRDLHAAQRRDFEERAQREGDSPALREELAAAILVWGMPGDRDWASGLLAGARTVPR